MPYYSIELMAGMGGFNFMADMPTDIMDSIYEIVDDSIEEDIIISRRNRCYERVMKEFKKRALYVMNADEWSEEVEECDVEDENSCETYKNMRGGGERIQSPFGEDEWLFPINLMGSEILDRIPRDKKCFHLYEKEVISEIFYKCMYDIRNPNHWESDKILSSSSSDEEEEEEEEEDGNMVDKLLSLVEARKDGFLTNEEFSFAKECWIKEN